MRVEFSSRVLALPLRTYRRPSNASFCAGIWKCDANKAGQVFSAKERFVGGIRNPEGLDFDTSGRFVGLPSEEVLIVKNGAWYGWPQCFFDPDRMKLVLAPEYGGDGGKKTGDCDMAEPPVAVFPAHWAQNDLKFYKAEFKGQRLDRLHGCSNWHWPVDTEDSIGFSPGCRKHHISEAGSPEQEENAMLRPATASSSENGPAPRSRSMAMTCSS